MIFFNVVVISFVVVIIFIFIYKRSSDDKVIEIQRNMYLDLVKSIVKLEVYTNQISLTMIAEERLDNVRYLIERIINNHIKGDIVECGTWRGGAMAYARSILNIYNETNRVVHLFDTFAGFPCLPTSQYVYERSWCKDKRMNDISIESVKNSFRKLNLINGVKFHKGLFVDTIKDDLFDKIAVLRLDADSYDNTLFLLEKLYSKVEKNGYVIIDDYGDWKSCKEAIHYFRDKNKINEKLQTIKTGAVYWIKK